MGCGVLLIVLGMVWPGIFTKKAVYTREQAEERQRASVEIHHAQYAYHSAKGDGHGHEHKPPPGAQEAHKHDKEGEETAQQAKQRFDEAKQAFDRTESELKAARRWNSTVAKLILWFGVVLAALGVGGYYVFKTEWAQQFVEE
jgi:hypothetical protein